MELLQLRYFYTVAKTLNISRAAAIHGIPQPAMSKTISRLERELDTPLFNRIRNQLSLTPAGHAFLQEVELSLQHLDKGLAAISCAAEDVCGELRLLVLQHRYVMVDFVESFRCRYPNASFYISNNKADLSDHGNFAICVAGAGQSGYFDSNMLLHKEEIYLVVPRQHRLAKKSCVQPEDLDGEPLIVQYPTHELYCNFFAMMREAGCTPQVAITSNDLLCNQKYLAYGMGVTLVSMQSADSLHSADTVMVPFARPLYRSVYLYWNRHMLHEPLVALFREHLIEEFRQLSQRQERRSAAAETRQEKT